MLNLSFICFWFGFDNSNSERPRNSQINAVDRNLFILFDVLIIVGSILSLTVGATEGMLTTNAMKILRLIQIMRVARIDRRGATWDLVSSVIYSHRKELITSYYIGFLSLLVTSYMMFVTENYSNPSAQFKSLADAFYWGIITATTVGYGDITPQTWLGKTICVCGSIVTIAFFALPAGILGSGFALKVQQKQKLKHYNKQIPAAATLIQMFWRYNRTNCRPGFNSTWAKYTCSAGEYRSKHWKRCQAAMAQNDVKAEQTNSDQANAINEDVNNFENYELTQSQVIMIRVIMTIQLKVARKKFQQIRHPYDVHDIIEQYSQGHFHIMIKLKELHRKMDQNITNISEYKVQKQDQDLAVINSIDLLNNKINQLETLVLSMHKAIMKKKRKDFQNDRIKHHHFNLKHLQIDESSDYESNSDTKNSGISGERLTNES